MFTKIRNYFSEDKAQPKLPDAFDSIPDKDFLLRVVESNWDVARSIEQGLPNHTFTITLTLKRDFPVEEAKNLLSEIIEEISNVN